MSTLAVNSIENLSGDERFGPVLTAQTTFAGLTTYTFGGIPTYVQRLYIHFRRVSTGGTAGIRVQVGDVGGISESGYESSSVRANHSSGTSGGSSTAGFYIATTAAVDVVSGIIIVSDMGSTDWASSHALHCEQVGVAMVNICGGGAMSGGPASGALTQIRINTANGTDTLDSGVVSISYE